MAITAQQVKELRELRSHFELCHAQARHHCGGGAQQGLRLQPTAALQPATRLW